MTDRFHTLTVVLERDVREDDAQQLMRAIGALRGVLSVTGVVANIESHMAITRARSYLTGKILGALEDPADDQ